MPLQLPYIVSHLMNNAVLYTYMVYTKADAQQYNYKMYSGAVLIWLQLTTTNSTRLILRSLTEPGEFAPRVVRGSSVQNGDYR